MDSFVDALEDAATSFELKSAVDSLPQNEKYYTEKIRDLLIAKKDLITDATTADSVMKFLLEFSRDELVCLLLQIKQVQELIINNIAPHVTAIYEFGRTICRIAQNETTASFFSNVESFSAILTCFHRSATSNQTRWIASTINNILFYNPSSINHLLALPVVEAFSFIIPLAEDDEAVDWISNALLQTLGNSEDAQEKFGTPEFLKIFQEMEKHATTDESKISFESIVDFVRPVADCREALQKSLSDSTSPQQLTSALESVTKQPFRFVSLIELLLQQQHLIQDQETAIAVADFIDWFAKRDTNPIIKKEIFEMIENVLIPKFNNNTDPIFWTFATLFKEESARNYFAKTSFRDFVCSSISTSGQPLLQALDLLLSNNNTAKEIFGIPDFHKKFVAKYRENSSDENKKITKILDEVIATIRLESLKKLAKEHKSNVDEDVLQKLAESGVDATNLRNLGEATLNRFQFGFAEISIVLDFIKTINGAPPPPLANQQQDLFALGELERLRKEHDELRKLHQEYVEKTNKTIADLKKDRVEAQKTAGDPEEENASEDMPALE